MRSSGGPHRACGRGGSPQACLNRGEPRGGDGDADVRPASPPRAREHTDPRALLDHDEPTPPPADDIPAEVKARLLRDFKAKHYAGWIDEPLPALDGETPRNAARTKAGRTRVDVLLKEMEHHEARLPDAERFDFSQIRAALGLPR